MKQNKNSFANSFFLVFSIILWIVAAICLIYTFYSMIQLHNPKVQNSDGFESLGAAIASFVGMLVTIFVAAFASGMTLLYGKTRPAVEVHKHKTSKKRQIKARTQVL